MEAELESDKSGPVCIVNRYRHSKRQRMMEKQLDAESPTCSPAGDENEQNHQHTSFAAGSHDFQESPTHTSVGCKRRHEPKDQPTSLSTGGHRFLASPTRAGAGSDGRHEQREHRDQPTSSATGGHESHGGRLWRGTMPAVRPTRLGSANAADSVLCPIGHLRLKLRQNDRREKVFKHHQMTNTKCLQKQGHDRRQACPECGKKFAGPRQRYVSTWDVAQPWGINEPTPTPMKWGGRQWKAFPYPIQWGGPALDWEEERRGGGKKGCAKPTETCRHDRHKNWQQLTQTPKKTHPPPKNTTCMLGICLICWRLFMGGDDGFCTPPSPLQMVVL